MRVDMSMESGPEDISLLERCPHQRVLCTGFNGVGTRRRTSIRDVSSFKSMYRFQWSWDLSPRACIISIF